MKQAISVVSLMISLIVLTATVSAYGISTNKESTRDTINYQTSETVESRDIVGIPGIEPVSFMGNQANLTMGSVECPSIRRVIVWVNDKRKVDWDGTSEIPEIKVKLGDIIDMKICCNNNHYSCPATLSVWDLEGKLLPRNKIPAYKVNCVQLRSKVRNKIEGTALIKMSLFADCQQGCGNIYDMLRFSM